MTPALRLGITLLATAASAGAAAQGDGIDPAAGRRLAERWCADCHVVAPLPHRLPPDGGPPDFVAIANDPTTTGLGLSAFLRTPHARMPDIRLSGSQIAELTSYILSLKGR